MGPDAGTNLAPTDGTIMLRPIHDSDPQPSSEIRETRTPRPEGDPSPALLSTVIDKAGIAVAVYDTQGRCVFSSANMALLMGETPEAWCRRRLWDAREWKLAGLLRNVMRTLVDGSPRSCEFDVRGLGRRVGTVHRIGDAEHGLVAVTATVLAQSAPPPRQVTMEDLKAFAQATAHRVNNGLVQATCALDMLLEKAEDSRSHRMLLQQALDSILRVSQGVTEAAETLLRGPRPSITVDLYELVDEVVGNLSPPDAARTAVNRSKLRGLPMTPGSAAEIRGAISHVVLNALEACPHGSVQIGGSMVKNDELTYLSSGDVVQAGSYAVLEVVDEGPGLAAAAMKRATLPFFSTKLLGRGLGLASTAKIARDHGGGVDMTSRPDGGTTVRVWLAMVSEDAEVAR
jgi:signal transduction histidine kinase